MAANRLLRQEHIDCVLVGALPTQPDGLAFLREASRKHPAVPFIFLLDEDGTGASDALSITDQLAYEQGAVDVLLWDELSPALLARSVRYAITLRREGQATPASNPARLMANMQEALVAMDADFRLTAWNPAAERMYGWKAEEVIGRSLFEVIRFELPRVEIARALNSFVRTGSYRIESAQYRRDGSPVRVESTAIALFDVKGRMDGYILSNRDVTERHQAEKERENLLARVKDARKRSEQMALEARARAEEMDAVFNALTDAVIIYDLKDQPVRANPAAIDMLGFDPTGQDWCVKSPQIQLLHSDGSQVPLEEQPLFRQRRGEQVRNEALQMVNIHGESFNILVSAAPLYQKKKLSGTVIVWHDYTDLVRLMTDLDAERTRLSTLFANAPEAIVLADSTGQIIYSNPRAEALYIQSIFGRRENGKQRMLQLLTANGEKYEAKDLPLTRSVKHGETHVNLEIGVLLKNGQTRSLLASTAPIIDRKGAITGAVGVFQDITQRKQAEAEIRKRESQIEVQHYLTQFRDREHLNIAHELHDGPLQELISINFKISELMAITQEEDMVEELRSTSSMVGQLIQGVRGFCNELRPPALGRFGLDKAIRSFIDKFEGSLPETIIRLDLEPDQLLSEEIRIALFRILKELMKNIVRHAQADEVIIRLAFDDWNVNLTVQDNGVGFDLPDQWVDLARQGHLGLVGVQERAEAVGGTASVRSRIGEGTVINISVPVRMQHQIESNKGKDRWITKGQPKPADRGADLRM